MRSEIDDRTTRHSIETILNKAGFEIISIRGIDEGDYWIHLKRGAKDSMKAEYAGKVIQ